MDIYTVGQFDHGVGMRKMSVSAFVGLIVIGQVVMLLHVPEGALGLTPHSAIFINGNQDFTPANGVTGGSGTPGDPYVISGWDINNTGSDGITIQNTNAYFKIQDVWVSEGFNFKGILLHNTTHGQLYNVNLTGNEEGVHVWFSQDLSITNSYSHYNTYGIFVQDSSQVNVGNNVLNLNGYYGIWIWNSKNIIVTNNTITEGQMGIRADLSSGLGFKNNLFSGNSDKGVMLAASDNASVSGNRIEYNGYGIYSNWNFSQSSMPITITDNEIRNNGKGVYLTSFNNFTNIDVYLNDFINNSIQAYDDSLGSQNSWDGGCLFGGNYWSDYLNLSDNVNCVTGLPGQDGFADSPYYIDSNSIDHYPLMTPWSGGQGNNTSPVVSLYSPSGGEDWTGGHDKIIAWNAWDAEDPQSALLIDIAYSANGGGTWNSIVTNLPGNDTSYTWSVPAIDTTTAMVRVCATDTGGLTGCSTSQDLTIDSTAPQVSFTEPADNAVDVGWNASVKVHFDERMNNNSGFIAIIPPIAGFPAWDPGYTVYTFAPLSPWTPCTYFTIQVTSFQDDSDPGNPMAGPYSFTFRTKCPGPPTLTLQRPVGGEYWRGGSQQLITWTAVDDLTLLPNITFFVNYTSSASSGSVVGPVKGNTSCLWNLPMIDATDVRINLTAIDTDGNRSWIESGPFTIDSTPPSLSTHAPNGWNVPLTGFATVTFSEPVDATPAGMKAKFGLVDEDHGGWVAVTPAAVPPGAWAQEIRFAPVSQLRPCTTYRAFVNGTFADRAAWTLSNPTNWTFHTVCAPTVSWVSQPPARVLSGGSSIDISWTMGDETDLQLRIYVNYSRNDGADGYPYAVTTYVQAVGSVAYAWTLPLVDTTAARVKVTVKDISGLTSSIMSGNFTIDSTPPAVLSSSPSDGAWGVKISDDFQIVFTEAVVRPTAEQAFSILPDPGDIQFNWSVTTSGKDVLTVSHKPLKSKTDYIIAFSTVLRDTSDPGNNPKAALTIHFSTKPPPPVNPPVAKAVGKNQVQVDERVLFDGSRSTGNISQYVWTIKDNQGTIVDVLTGEYVYFTFTKNGRYSVTLRVIDNSSGLFSEDVLQITVTSNSNGLLILLLVSALLLTAGILGGTEIGRVPIITFLLAAVNRRKFDKNEDSLGRGMVLGYIVGNPGDNYTDIRKNLGIGNGHLSWHLMKLEKDGVIKSRNEGIKKRYYPAKMPLPVENGGDLHEIQKRLLKSISGTQGKPVKLLAEELGVSSQLALYHLRQLAQKRLLTLERRGFQLKACPPSRQN